MGRIIVGTAFATALLVLAGHVAPATAADYFAGKTIDMVIGGNPGGGYDLYARNVARHMPRYIPGNPTIVSKNLPGAGSNKAAAYIFQNAAKDGTQIGAVYPGAIVGPLTDEALKAQFDSTKFEYIGSADSGSRVCATWHTNRIKSFADTLKEKVIVGASADGGSSKDFPVVLNAIASTKFEIISGYKGTVDIILAVERGEVDGLCGYDWSSLKAQRPDWVRDKKLNLLVQMSMEPEPELTALGVPEVWGFLKSPDDRKIIELLVSQQLFGRPYILPPGTPKEVVGILRQAFEATVKDPAYLADAAQERLSVSPASGAKVQSLVASLFATPRPIVERYEKAMISK